MTPKPAWPESLTGDGRRQAAVLGGAAATSHVILVLGAGHHEVCQGAWDILGKVLREFRFRDQGILWTTTRDGLQGASGLFETVITSPLSKNTLF